tara:strand:- start:120 stop:530 length:411 start_codon:yes stop_codon:yes gene_type:complete
MKKLLLLLLFGFSANAEQWEYVQMTYNEKKGAKEKMFTDGIYFSIQGAYQNKAVIVGIHFDMNYKTTKLRRESFEERWKKAFGDEYKTDHMETVGIVLIDFANNLGRKGFELVDIVEFKDEVNDGEKWMFKRKLNQ